MSTLDCCTLPRPVCPDVWPTAGPHSTYMPSLRCHFTAVVVATHQPAFLGHVDRCVLLQDGHLAHDGPTTDALVRTLQGEG